MTERKPDYYAILGVDKNSTGACTVCEREVASLRLKFLEEGPD
jgi:hypothetical protein